MTLDKLLSPRSSSFFASQVILGVFGFSYHILFICEHSQFSEFYTDLQDSGL